MTRKEQIEHNKYFFVPINEKINEKILKKIKEQINERR